MKRILKTFWFPVAVMSILCMGCSGGSPRVLLIARETSDDMRLMIEKEVAPMIQQLKKAGYAVTVASESGSTITADRASLHVDAKLSGVKIGDYAGVLVPCMAAGRTAKEIPQNAVQLVAAAGRAGLPIAAQQSGVRILGLAGVLAGRSYTMAEELRDLDSAGTYKGTGVVRDGLVATSGTCPYMAAQSGLQDGTAELTGAFISMLKK
jgi:putative intracellular protease/amidase